MIYNGRPINLGIKKINVTEYFSYHYYPVKLKGQEKPVFEPRLKPFSRLVGSACCDFIGRDGLDRYMDSYVYITAKHQYQRKDIGFNRLGWHTDGFGTDDITYIWSNKQPTVFNDTKFDLSDDDILSMKEMEEQADPKLDYTLANNSLLRIDPFVVHRVGDFEEGNRCFFKLVISKDKFALEGNSINYMLNYSWDYTPRKVGRNVPQGDLNETKKRNLL